MLLHQRNSSICLNPLTTVAPTPPAPSQKLGSSSPCQGNGSAQWRVLIILSLLSTDLKQTPLTHGLALSCPIISKIIPLENKIRHCFSLRQASRLSGFLHQKLQLHIHAYSSSCTAQPYRGRHLGSSAVSNSLKTARAAHWLKQKLNNLHGCKLHPKPWEHVAGKAEPEGML